LKRSVEKERETVEERGKLTLALLVGPPPHTPIPFMLDSREEEVGVEVRMAPRGGVARLSTLSRDCLSRIGKSQEEEWLIEDENEPPKKESLCDCG
jgi:hypothetical protein